MYKVLETFQDKDGSIYYKGETFPREGVKMPSKARLKVLTTTENQYDTVFIEEVKGNDTGRTETTVGKAGKV